MTLKEQAQDLRRDGLSLHSIAEQLGVSFGSIVWLCKGAVIDTSPRIDWDGDCWRIYVYEAPRSGPGKMNGEPQAAIVWWPLSWLRFATREAAEAHLAKYGDYSA